MARAILGAHDAERPAALAREMPEPSMVSENFSYFLGRWPGAMAYLGAQVESGTSFNHFDDVRFDRSIMTVGLAFLSRSA